MSKKLTANPVSPKVTFPFLALLLANVLEVAATQDWSQENTYVAIITLVQVVVGYLVTDPNRSTESV